MCHDAVCEHEKEELRAENARLRSELEKLKKPPKDSSNSSIAPSQDPYKKPYPKREKSGKKPGGQPGHPGQYRPFEPNPDRVESLYPSHCPYCSSTELEHLPQAVREIRQEVSLPPPVQAFVTEYRQCQGKCKGCGKTSWGEFPEHIRAPQELSATVEGLVGYLKVHHQQSNVKIQSLLTTLYNLHLGKATIENILTRLSGQFQAEMDRIKQGLQQSFVVGSDETGIRINGRKGYQFVFQNAAYCLYQSGYSRGYRVIEEVFQGTFPEVWVSDRYGAQLKTPSDKHQLCLAHILRECRYIIEAEQSEWTEDFKQLLKEAIALRQATGEDYNPLEADTFRGIKRVERQMETLFSKPPPKELERKLFQGLCNRQEQLLTFLHDPDIPFDNNGSERALRNRKTHLKVIGGFRSEQGVKRVDVIASILETATRQGKNMLDVLSRNVALFPSTV